MPPSRVLLDRTLSQKESAFAFSQLRAQRVSFRHSVFKSTNVIFVSNYNQVKILQYTPDFPSQAIPKSVSIHPTPSGKYRTEFGVSSSRAPCPFGYWCQNPGKKIDSWALEIFCSGALWPQFNYNIRVIVQSTKNNIYSLSRYMAHVKSNIAPKYVKANHGLIWVTISRTTFVVCYSLLKCISEIFMVLHMAISWARGVGSFLLVISPQGSIVTSLPAQTVTGCISGHLRQSKPLYMLCSLLEGISHRLKSSKQ